MPEALKEFFYPDCILGTLSGHICSSTLLSRKVACESQKPVQYAVSSTVASQIMLHPVNSFSGS